MDMPSGDVFLVVDDVTDDGLVLFDIMFRVDMTFKGQTTEAVIPVGTMALPTAGTIIQLPGIRVGTPANFDAAWQGLKEGDMLSGVFMRIPDTIPEDERV